MRSVQQQEKIRRDRLNRSTITREKRLEQQKLEKREEDLTRAMQTRESGRHAKKRSIANNLYKFMRPLSMAFTAETGMVDASPARRSPEDMDFEPIGKPALVLNLVDARITPFVNSPRAFTFCLDTEDGARYLFQAPTKADFGRWMSAISKTAQATGRKRLTWISDAPKPQLADHLQAKTSTSIRDPVKGSTQSHCNLVLTCLAV